jgi:O-6-methylguanine DNA methyltransferase
MRATTVAQIAVSEAETAQLHVRQKSTAFTKRSATYEDLELMIEPGYTLFNTSIGTCGVAWREVGIVGVQLPDGNQQTTRERLAMRFADLRETAPRGAHKRTTEAIVGLLEGRARDLSSITLDMSAVSDFQQAVYCAARNVARGQTVTYAELADLMGRRAASRAVGQALGNNPFPIVVPCHRILAADGKAGGFSAAGGITTKMRILKIEGAAQTNLHGFEYDPYEAVDYLRQADKKLARIIDAVGPPSMEIRQTSSVFLALTQAIVYQQLSGKAAATILGRVCDLFPGGKRGLNAKNILATDTAALRGAGLSNNKMLALRDLAERAQAGLVPSLAKLKRMDNDAIIETLTAVRGIGRWTVEMLLMWRLGRADIIAVDDLGLRQGHAIVVGKQGETDRKALAAYAERWRPYRSVASWYLWRAVDLSRNA